MIASSFGSTLTRCANASSRILLVVETPIFFVGETSSTDFVVTSLCVSGVTRAAFVPCGTARRFLGGGGLIFPCRCGDDMILTIDGVGVMGGGVMATFLRRGVVGLSSVSLSAGKMFSFSGAFRFLLMLAFFAGGRSGEAGLAACCAFIDAELSLAERLVDIVN